MTKYLLAAGAALGLLLFSTSIEAQEFCGDRYCAMSVPQTVKPYIRGRAQYVVADRQERIVAHPAGCPRKLFCGCGASVEIFGKPIRKLYLARAWGMFPSAAPGPGMAAWRNGHVFVIRSVNGDGTVVAYDANSGGRLTRVHTVSLRGYRVVNPHGVRVAALVR